MRVRVCACIRCVDTCGSHGEEFARVHRHVVGLDRPQPRSRRQVPGCSARDRDAAGGGVSVDRPACRPARKGTVLVKNSGSSTADRRCFFLTAHDNPERGRGLRAVQLSRDLDRVLERDLNEGCRPVCESGPSSSPSLPATSLPPPFSVLFAFSPCHRWAAVLVLLTLVRLLLSPPSTPSSSLSALAGMLAGGFGTHCEGVEGPAGLPRLA